VIGIVCCNILNCISFHLNTVYYIKSSPFKFVTVFLEYYFLSIPKKNYEQNSMDCDVYHAMYRVVILSDHYLLGLPAVIPNGGRLDAE